MLFTWTYQDYLLIIFSRKVRFTTQEDNLYSLRTKEYDLFLFEIYESAKITLDFHFKICNYFHKRLQIESILRILDKMDLILRTALSWAKLYSKRELNPHEHYCSSEFKSDASTIFAIRACVLHLKLIATNTLIISGLNKSASNCFISHKKLVSSTTWKVISFL